MKSCSNCGNYVGGKRFSIIVFVPKEERKATKEGMHTMNKVYTLVLTGRTIEKEKQESYRTGDFHVGI